MIYRGFKDEIHLLLTFATLMTIMGCLVALLGMDISHQKSLGILLSIIGIIFTHIAHYKYQQNPKTYYPTSVMRVVSWGNLGFVIYMLFF